MVQPEEALLVTEILEAIYESGRIGKPVFLINSASINAKGARQMKLGVFTVLLAERQLADALAYLKAWGCRQWNWAAAAFPGRPMLIRPAAAERNQIPGVCCSV